MIGTVLNQRFRLEKELGRGGMGAVYSATDQVLGRTVAIKVLKGLKGQDVGRRIRLEAQISARLLHENIVRLYDIGEAEGAYYLVMEEVDGPSFQKRMRKLGLRARFQVVSQTADALDYAHRQGVIHRDVKPANILLTSSDQAKLSDFGLSMVEGLNDDSGIVRGTPHYMSPEQALGKKVDHRTDLYALGVILYEAATGTLPFMGQPREIMAMQVGKQPDSPRSRNPRISADVDALILWLMNKAPETRPASGTAAASAIRSLIETDQSLSDASPEERPVGPATSQSIAANGQAGRLAAPAPPAPAAPRPVAGEPAAKFDADAPGLALADCLLKIVENEPIALSPDDRYRCGHYLAYLLGGSRKRGILGKRPLDELNADRARLLLAMASIMHQDANEASITLASTLMDQRPEIRTRLSPIVVAKYVGSRDTPAKRRKFRQARAKLQEASRYAQEHLLDPNGALNPGLMPQTLADLDRIAPPRTEVDDQLVGRWNLIADVWRSNAKFRNAVLTYATRSAASDPSALRLWPEVVYPLIERARWQRRTRTRLEALKDAILGKLLHLQDSGLKLDHELSAAVSRVVVEELDHSVHAFAIDPEKVIEDEREAGADADEERLPGAIGPVSYENLGVEDASAPRARVALVQPDPILRLTLADLGAMWRDAYAALTGGATAAGAGRQVPLGPYRLAVIATIRGKSAGQVAIQGMANKQIELLTPSLRISGTKPTPTLAVWLYRDNSLAIAYLDNRNDVKYVHWAAATARQSNFDLPGELIKSLIGSGLEAPEHLDDVLSKDYRPANPVS